MIIYTGKYNSIFEVTSTVRMLEKTCTCLTLNFKKLQIQRSRKVETAKMKLSLLSISLQFHP